MVKPQYKDKSLTIYFPDSESLEALKKQAAATLMNPSQYIVQLLDEKQGSLFQEAESLREENEKLRHKVEQFRQDLEDIRKYSREIEIHEIEELNLARYNVIHTLKRGGLWTSQRLVRELNEDMRLVDMQQVSRIMTELEVAELIVETSKGWKWVG